MSEEQRNGPARGHPRLGDTIGYRLEIGINAGEVRPAIVVRVNSDNTLSLNVFCDREDLSSMSPVLSRGDVRYDGGALPGTWCWLNES